MNDELDHDSCEATVSTKGANHDIMKKVNIEKTGWVTTTRKDFENKKGRTKNMIALGCDHGGYELMQEVIKHLEERGLEYKNFGCYSTESVDYPVYGQAAAKAVASGECDKGIIICGTGIGISISANKIKGIRAALCHDCFSAQATREHNDANMLAMGARVIGPGLALKIVDIFLDTPFSNDERHVRRIGMIE